MKKRRHQIPPQAVALLASVTLVLALFRRAVVTPNAANGGLRFSSSSSSLLSPHGRPVMHTFFHRIDPSIRTTGMKDSDDERLLDAWKKAWNDAGWDAQIVTLDDARKHVDFEMFNRTLDGIVESHYKKLNFLRWLGMAMVGGGWMCDYDTFPLATAAQWSHNFATQLPNQGRLTVYDRIKAGGGVPSLVSGSAQEWDRVAHLILGVASQYAISNDVRGDQKSLVQLDTVSPNSFDVNDGVVKGRLVLRGDEIDEETCAMTKDQAAIHFSHRAIYDGQLMKEGQGVQDRAEIATEWLHKWAAICGSMQ